MKNLKVQSVALTLTSLFILSGLLTLYSCARNPVTGKRELMLLGQGQERAMGEQADPEIVAFFGLYDDPQLQRFIDQKGEEMANISHRKNLDWEFKIVDSPVLNAFAVPGGFVYFTRGIMAHFNNEAEFAGVLGHEIGHVTARHSAQQYSKAMLAQVGLTVGMVVSETFAQFSDVVGQGVGLLFLKYGRDAERESDKLGAEYSSKIGYDAHQMAQFFNTLQRKAEVAGQEPVPTFLSTHPHPSDRLEKVHEYAEYWQQKLNLENPDVNRNSYLRMIDGIVYGEDPRQGYREGNIFYHPVLKFQFPIPAGWAFQNTPQQVQMAPEGGEAMMMLTLVQANSLQEAAQQVLEKYNLEAVESRNVTVNGLNALALIADQQQEQGTIRVLSYLISYDNNIYNMMGVAALNNFSNHARVFTSVMEAFSPLTDPSKINVQPERVNIREVTQSTTLQQALSQFGVPNERLEELAVLNGMQLNEQVSSGTLIKVIGK
ncbi:MAG: M48 family metalloprotease [Candidatus Cyclobacteriaceae bacterium M2_1C_046]